MLELAGKLYPNGEFGLSRIKRCKVSVLGRRKLSEEQEWTIRCLQVHGLLQTIFFRKEVLGRAATGLPLGESPPLDPLGSSLLSKSHRRKRGDRGISRYSARMVRNAAFLLERKYGRNVLSFLTYTLPVLTPDEWQKVCDGWSEIVRVALQRLRRSLVRVGLPDYVVSVTELQEGRLERYGVPGLHLHILFVGRNRHETWKLKPSEVRSIWISAVESCLGYSLGSGAWKSCENIQAVRRSASGYLGKYMTKGVRAIGLFRAKCPQMSLPSSWSNLSASLRTWVKREILPIGRDTARMLLTIAESGEKELVSHFGKVEMQMEGGGVLTLGVFGRLTRQCYQMIRELYYEEKSAIASTYRV